MSQAKLPPPAWMERLLAAGDDFDQALAIVQEMSNTTGVATGQALAHLATLPTVDVRVFDLRPMRSPWDPQSDGFLEALYANPVFPFLLLTVPAEQQSETTDRILRSLIRLAPSTVPPGIDRVSLFDALTAWRQGRGLPAVLDRYRESRFQRFQDYAEHVLEVTKASVLDIVVYCREWDDLWRQAAAKHGVVLPRNPRLDRIVVTLDLQGEEA